MHFFGFLYGKKKIAPSSRSSTHHASNGQDLYCVKRAKIKEIFGDVTPKGLRGLDKLLNKMSWRVNPSSFGDGNAYDEEEEEEDEESADADSIEKVEEKSNDSIAVMQHEGRSKSDLQVSTTKVELAVKKLGQSSTKAPHAKPVEEPAIRKPCSMDVTMKSHATQVPPWKLGSVDMTTKANTLQVGAKTLPAHQLSEDITSTRKLCGAMDSTSKMSPAPGSARKYRQVRPPKLTCVGDKAAALMSSRNCLCTTSERCIAHHNDIIKWKEDANCHGSFPLPPPFASEKHYLPTPQNGTLEEVLCVAHPLPQPRPLTPVRSSNGCVLEQSDNRGHTQIAQAISCDALSKVHLRKKEYILVRHAKSLDPPKHLMPRQKGSQNILGGGFPVPSQGLTSSPSTSSCLKSHQNPQTPQVTPSTNSQKQHHHTFQFLQSTLTARRLQTNQPPRGPLSPLTGTEARQTPQSTQPTTPRAQHCLTLHVLESMPPTSPLLEPHQPPRKSLSTATGTEFHPTPPITPPTTPRKQNYPTDQGLQSRPPASPPPLYHQTPQNVLSTVTGSKFHQASENTPPTTPRKEHDRTLQNFPPTRQLNPQVFSDVTGKVQSPPPSNRKPPQLTSLCRQSPPHFPSLHVQSPPCSPLWRSLCPRKWKKGVILGQGTFGAVYEGWNLEDGSFFAVKVSSREDALPEIQQEVDVLSKLEHPNIVQYYGSSLVDNRLCIFLELVRMGSLESLLLKYKHFEEDTIRNYTRQILLGLEYLHGKKTLHRDIKCGNILVDVNGQVKLSDFGIAKQVDESLASSLKGTPLYMAPEVLIPSQNSKSSYSFPADIWSLGCTVFELADGKPPWSNLKGYGFFFKVKKRELPPMPEHLSPDGKDFIRSCLQFHPEDRPTASELLQHRFVFNVPTPEPLLPLSPSSPLSPKLWQAASPLNSRSWACGHSCLSSPIHETCFDRGLGGSQKVQTLIQGR